MFRHGTVCIIYTTLEYISFFSLLSCSSSASDIIEKCQPEAPRAIKREKGVWGTITWIARRPTVPTINDHMQLLEFLSLTALVMMMMGYRTAAFVSRTMTPARCFVVRGLADISVDVEHGKGKWKTYGDLENYKPGKFQIKTFNKISPVGLARFPEERYDVRQGDDEAMNAHAILMRSHQLQEDEVAHTVRAIAR